MNMRKNTFFTSLILLFLLLLVGCTHHFSYQYHFKLKDESGKSLSGAEVYLASTPMYPVIPWWHKYWFKELDMQRDFKSVSDNDGAVSISIAEHKTFYSKEDFYVVVHKKGYWTTVIPFAAMRPSIVLYRTDSKAKPNNEFTFVKEDVFSSGVGIHHYHREYHDSRILLYKPIPARLSKSIQQHQLEL